MNNTSSTSTAPGPCSDNDYAYAINKIWVLACAAMIFSMQVGFAFLEAGSIRKKNSHVVFYKLTLHSLFGVLAFWLFGYAFAFGDAFNNYIGGNRFYAGSQWIDCQADINEVTQYANWTFQYSIAVVVVAITNGSISERTSLKASCIHTLLMVGLIYPVTLAWTWGNGWLTQQGYMDFTGSGVVHCTGAFAGLAGLIMVGPRYNRWDKYVDVFEESGHEVEMKGLKSIALDRIGNDTAKSAPSELSKQVTVTNVNRIRSRIADDEYEAFGVSNLSWVLFGGMFLWLDFIFFNAGSTLGMYKSGVELWKTAEIAAVNTFMGGCSAGLLALVVKTPLMGGWKAQRKLRDEAAGVCNAFLAGMVANGAGMNNYDPWAAWVVGLIGGSFYLILCKVFDVLKIDDAVEAVQLHGGGGTAGVLCVAFFNKVNGIYYGNPTHGMVFGKQLMGWVVISLWSFSCSLVIYGLCKIFGILRTDLKTEVVGYDFVEFAKDVDFREKKLQKADHNHAH